MTEQRFQYVLESVEGFLNNSDVKQARRIYHGRGSRDDVSRFCHLDAYWPVMLITGYCPLSCADIDFFKKIFKEKFNALGFSHLVYQDRSSTIASNHFLVGEPLNESLIFRGYSQFKIKFNSQNVGYFPDMETGRKWLDGHARGKRVLNLFAYSSTLSVVALVAGAEHVVNVDMSKSALSLGRENHLLNGVHKKASFLPLNILKSWSRIKKPGPYDLIIIDPPSFQKGSFVAEKDYCKVISRIPDLADPGADILAC